MITKLELENVTIKIDPNIEEEFTGGFYCRVNTELFKRYFEDNDEIPYLSEYNEDNIELLDDDYVEFSNSDAFIVFFEYLLNYLSDEKHEIEVATNEPFWVIHDYFHAKNDVASNTVYVDADIEEQRIEQAFNYIVEHFPEENIFEDGYNYLEEIDSGFKNRFGRFLNVEGLYEYVKLQTFGEELEEELY